MAGKVALDIPRDVLIEKMVALATQAAIAHHEGRPDEAETHLNGLVFLLHGLDELDGQAIINWLLASEEVPMANMADNEHFIGLFKKIVERVIKGEHNWTEPELQARAAEMGLKPTGMGPLFLFPGR
uniref:Uncharacterized protein n=1 Tax=Caulobacter sp. (strain K31) TaxID=366602 RepID=B0T625_CAUSK